MSRRVRDLVGLIALALGLGACSRDHAGWLIINWSIVGEGESYELGVAEAASCPTQDEFIEQASDGSRFLYYAAGAWADRNDAPAIGELPDRRLAFAALLRDEDCVVLGYGCVLAKPSDGSSVTVHVDFPSPPRTCSGTCADGLCDESSDGADAGLDGSGD